MSTVVFGSSELVANPTHSSASVVASKDQFPSRVVGRVASGRKGNTLICVAGLHGNEPSGVEAVRSVISELQSSSDGLEGEVVGLVGNRRALQLGKRFVERDLNRIWTSDVVSKARNIDASLSYETDELRDLDREFSRIAKQASGKVFVLDLHSVSGPGPPFIALDDTLANRQFASEFPIPVVLGLEEELAGTLTGYLTRQGMISLGFESGQHDEPESVRNAEAAIWIALEASGVLSRGKRAEVALGRATLSEETRSLPGIVEIRHRQPVKPDERFSMMPGFCSFQRVTAGQELALSGEEIVRAAESGFVLMPLYQAQGEDGFFVARRVKALWLRVSAIVRRLRLGRLMHLLPGIQAHPDQQGSFIVDLRKARWQARELFHLLGFRRTQAEDHYLVMSPRTPVPR